MPRQHVQQEARLEASVIAARALIDGRVADFDSARYYAAAELGLEPAALGLENLTIHRALVDQLSLFHLEPQKQLIARLRGVARQAMAVLQCFEPRLCGPVLYGTAIAGLAINIHLFCDEVEAVTRFLLERKIDYQLGEREFRFGKGKMSQAIPVFDVELCDEWLELAVFPTRGQWRTPTSSLNQRQVRRVALAELDALLTSERLFPGELLDRSLRQS